MSGCGALTVGRAYHTIFPPRVLRDNTLICHLEALNAALAIKLWAPHYMHQLIHLFCDNQATVTIFQAGWGKDAFFQACTRDIWQTCVQWVITLAVGHIPGGHLQETADALSRYHLGQPYQDRVSSLIIDKGISHHSVPDHLFTLSDEV